MVNLFLQILNMSITGAWIVLAVCVLRLVLKKAPKWVSASLWGLVAFRLVCPFSFESVLSILPSAQTVPTDIATAVAPAVHTGIPALNSTINPILSDSFAPNPGDSVNPLQVITFIAAIVWTVGMVGMLLYAAISYIRLRKKTKESIVAQENVYVCDRIDTPFILGLIKPRIYLPSSMEQTDVDHVLSHEQAHLQRRDHWWKPLGFLFLTVHWFNPVLWAGYVLLCRDIELACDEKVIRTMNVQEKKNYSEALINCSVSRNALAACPLAFGEIGVKNRIKAVLYYKKPTAWILVIALLASTVAAVCLLTDPVNTDIGGYTYRIQRYYYDAVIGKDRANKEMGEITFEITDSLFTTRYLAGQFHCSFTFVPYAGDAEKLTDAVSAVLPIYYKMLKTEQICLSEGWDLTYFIIQFSNGNLIGGYIGSNDDVPGQIYKLQRTEKLPGGIAESAELPADAIEVKKALTLDDVLTLSKKGDALTWSDFEEHLYVSTGSGLYIRIYEIDEMFTLTIGGVAPESELMYAYLGANDGTRTVIDIRKDDVQTYIDEHKNNAVIADITEMSTWYDADNEVKQVTKRKE